MNELSGGMVSEEISDRGFSHFPLHETPPVPIPDCPVCLVAHDDAIHAATLAVRAWHRREVTKYFDYVRPPSRRRAFQPAFSLHLTPRLLSLPREMPRPLPKEPRLRTGHGSASYYRNYGCRCEACSAAQRAYRAERRAQGKRT
jgi:hypothetical protein